MDTLWQDMKDAARSLLRRPLVTGVAVLSLALGIGVNTAIFSVFERMVLRELPVRSPEEIVVISSPGRRPGSTTTSDAGERQHVFSYPLFRDLERLDHTGLSRIAAHRDFAANVAFDGTTFRAEALLVSGGYFPALEVAPALGRLLTIDDDRPGAPAAVVLSHALWTTRFGARPDVVGATVIVNGESMTVAGVAPEHFTGTTAMEQPGLFVPLAAGERLRGVSPRRDNHSLYLFARLRSGVTREAAEAALNGPFAALLRDVDVPGYSEPLDERTRQAVLARRIVLEDGARFRNDDREEATTVLSLLLGITGLVLMIACANVANLLLARAGDRAPEMAIRLAIGAPRGRLLRLLLIESALLGVLGAGAGLAVATATSRALLRILPADDAGVVAPDLNTTVLLFTLGLGLAAAFLFGLFPALQSIRSGGGPAAAGRHSAHRAATRFRRSLATAQIALATALVAVAALFIVSLGNLTRAELGLAAGELIGFRIWPTLNGYTPARAEAFLDALEADLRATPGVISVTTTNLTLLSDNSNGQNVTVAGFVPSSEEDLRVSSARVGPDYFRTVGIRLLAGREFSRADDATSAKVAIVNEAFARRFALGDGVIGRRVALGAGDNVVPDLTIVGLVRDAKYSQVRQPPPPQLFLPYRQAPVGGPVTFYVRHANRASDLRATIPALVARADPTLPVERLRTMDEQIWDNVTLERVLATLSGWLAALAAILAGTGLYALIAFTVGQRLKEVGIRMALGARPRDVRRLVFADVARIAVAGGAIGLAGALVLGELSQALLFGVEGTNVGIAGGAAAAGIALALAAAILPARRAALVDPVVTLRAE